MELAHPVLAILALALVTSAAAGAILHQTGALNPANTTQGDACGHEDNETQEHNETSSHSETGEHNETSDHDTNDANDTNEVCDDDSGEVPGHNDTDTGDDELNETED